jgi:tetratricopeptide (TPR) repeat protein
MDRQQKNHPALLQVFVSYADKDEKWRDELLTHLHPLQREGLISSIWHRGNVLPGIDQEQEINHHLEICSLILLLISPNFLACDSCYAIQMQRALQRHDASVVRVIPVLVRPCDWSRTPITRLQCLPHDGKAIAMWDNQDLAWEGVTTEIRKAIEGLSHPSVKAPVSLSRPVQNIPYSRNPFFTGREDVLEQLHTQFRASQSIALSQPLATCGLGGIGKTRIAVEYAHKYLQNYQHVLWARAESQEALISSYVHLASLLDLPVRDALSPNIAVQAVKRWLQDHSQWLLILDNADDLTVVRPFIPSVMGGHLLLTTRAQATGDLARRIKVETFTEEQGTFFLLRRAGLLAPDATFSQASIEDRTWATQIAQELGGLPLALDQAGAYLEETGTGLSDYLQIYRQHRGDLLKQRLGLGTDHPEPVATTWSLSFERVERRNPAAADLLRLCAFLDPDALPLEIVAGGATNLGPQLASVAGDAYFLDQAIKVLRDYSLVSRDPAMRTLSVHRLVQAVLQDAMTAEARKQWKERAVNVVSATFPCVEFAHWTECERWLPHALICRNWIEQERMTIPAASQLLARAGLYLRERAQYIQAELFFQQALAIDKQVYGLEHPEVATDLNNLACLYWSQGKYEETEPLFQSALEIRRQQLGHEDPDTAEAFNNLACLYQTRGKYKESESFFQQALVIYKQIYGPGDPAVGTVQSNLAEVYRRLGRYEEADSLLGGSLSIHKELSGPEHLDTAHILHKQAVLYCDRGRYEEAKKLFECTRGIYEKSLGRKHPNTAQIIHGMAEVSRVQGKYEEAEKAFQSALTTLEQTLGSEHSATASVLNSLAFLYLKQGKYTYVKQERCMKQGRYEEAEKLFQHALEIRKQKQGLEHPCTALILHNLALLYYAQDKYEEAEELFQSALEICRQKLAPEHPYRVHALYHLGVLRHTQKRYEEAHELFERVLKMRQLQLGHEHPYTIQTLHSLAVLSYDQKEYEKAAELFRCVLAVYEKWLGPEHPETLLVLRNYYTLLCVAGQDAETLLLKWG